jgi:hypothetical protein
MAITTGDGYIAAAKQVIEHTRTAAVTTVATTRHTVRGAAGNPGAGTLADVTGTPSGAVVTDADSSRGYPLINAFGGGNTGYLTRVQCSNSVVGRVEIWDKIYSCAVTTAQLGTLQTLTLSTQPSLTGRIPGGTDYTGLRIFVEITTTMSATATTINVTYTNQSGTTGRSSTVTASLSGFTASRWVEMPLQAGDSGVQKIETIVIGGATNAAGALNIIIAKRLWSARIMVANGGVEHGLDKTGMPIVFDTSALTVCTIADSTSSGQPDLSIEIANG